MVTTSAHDVLFMKEGKVTKYIHYLVNERISRWLNNREEAFNILKSIVQILKGAKKMEQNSNLQICNRDTRRGFPRFATVARAVRMAAFSSVPFSKLRIGVFNCTFQTITPFCSCNHGATSNGFKWPVFENSACGANCV